MLSVFFAEFFWRLSPFILRFCRVLPVLGFLSEGFSQRALEWESGVFWGSKTPFFRPENGEWKVLPFLAFLFGVVLLLRIVSGRVLGHELRVLYWRCFCSVLGVRFCMDFSICYREFFVSPFSGTRVSSFFLFLPLLLLLLLFWALWGPAWAPLRFLLLFAMQDNGHPLPVQAGAAFMFSVLFFFCLLCPGRPPSPSFPPSALSLSLSLCLSLSLYLSALSLLCMH